MTQVRRRRETLSDGDDGGEAESGGQKTISVDERQVSSGSLEIDISLCVGFLFCLTIHMTMINIYKKESTTNEKN